SVLLRAEAQSRGWHFEESLAEFAHATIPLPRDSADMISNIPAIGQQLHDAVLNPMKASFVGKDEIIDLMGVCLVGGENLFILGPPGTAKSALVHELGRRLDGTTFE